VNKPDNFCPAFFRAAGRLIPQLFPDHFFAVQWNEIALRIEHPASGIQ
jgi:hypothetical protein